jgi:hypothetical protein
MAATTAPAVSRPALIGSWADCQQMYRRVLDPDQTLRHWKGYIEPGFTTGLIGADQQCRFEQFFKINNLPTVLDERAFYVQVRFQKNIDHISPVLRFIEWILTKMTFWIRRNPENGVMALPSTLFQDPERQPLLYRWGFHNPPTRLTMVAPPEAPSGSTHEQAFLDLERQVAQKAPHENPYLYPKDIPGHELIIGKYRFSKGAQFYIFRSQALAPLQTEDCKSFKVDSKLEYVKRAEYEKKEGGLKVTFTVPEKTSRTGRSHPTDHNDTVFLIKDGARIFVLVNKFPAGAHNSVYNVPDTFASDVLDLSAALENADPKNFEFKAQTSNSSQGIRVEITLKPRGG